VSKCVYEIRVAGCGSTRPPPRLQASQNVGRPIGTALRAEAADQAQLHGLLDALRRAGVVLVDVRREQMYDDDIIRVAGRSSGSERQHEREDP
jgi:hypothetical protein